jgi:hypothetical protein
VAKNSINIRPGVGILGLFPNMNYRAWYALGELVDNAIDSYLTNKDRLRAAEGSDFRLRIVIDVEAQDGGFIKVWDNAAGIAAKDYTRAFVTAEPPTDSAGLSQFGIGMKSASCWFAREWRVRSTALGEKVQRTIEFDVPEIIRTNTETLNATSAPAPVNQHFTEVRLWNLYKPPQTQTVGKMRRHLASMYRQFLRTGDIVIEFNGAPLVYEEPAVLVAPSYRDPDAEPQRWRKDIDLTLSSGERVTGFVAIREKGSTKEAGLSLYRNHRLIVGSDDESFRPPEIFGGSNSYSFQRIFGELAMDDFEVSHSKDGFLWEDREDEVLRALRKEIDAPPLQLIQQAEGYRARKAPPDLGAAASRAAESAASVLPQAEAVIEGQVHDVPREIVPPVAYDGEVVNSTQSRQLKIKGQLWSIAVETTTDPAATEWLKVREKQSKGGKARELGILVSISHPFTQRFGGVTQFELEGLIRVAMGLAIAESTARASGAKMAGVVLKHLNELLGGVLAEP